MGNPNENPEGAMKDFFMNEWNLSPDDAQAMVESFGGLNQPFTQPQAPRQFNHEPVHQTPQQLPQLPSGAADYLGLSNPNFQAYPVTHEPQHQLSAPNSMPPDVWMAKQREQLIAQSKSYQEKMRMKEEAQAEHDAKTKELEIIRTIHQERQKDLRNQMHDIFGLFEGKTLGELASSQLGIGGLMQANSQVGNVTKLGK